MVAHDSISNGFEGLQCVTAALQVERLGIRAIVGLQRHRCTEVDGTEQRQRNDMPLGHDPMQVLQPDRHELHLGPLPGQVVDAGLERQQFITQIARAFGEDDQRVALRECVVKRLQGLAACSGDGRGVCGWVGSSGFVLMTG